MKSCSSCKHYKPNRWIFNLWGLIKDSDYHEFARCKIPGPSGELLYCAVQRHWDYKTLKICGKSGKNWEAK